jgi:transcriptional regulator with XRE-family HTH domain
VKASTFGERLAYAQWWRAGVVRRDLTQEDLAGELGISGPAFSQWRDKVDPVESMKVEKLAQLCDVPFDWMMRGERTEGAIPPFFDRFLPVYRDWVKRGGLKRQRARKGGTTIVATKRSSEDEARKKRDSDRGRRNAG